MGRCTGLCMLVLAGILVMPSYSLIDRVFNVEVVENITKPTFCRRDFLSVALGDGLIQNNFNNFNSKTFQNLAAALSPANLRFGGSRANFLTFDEHAIKRKGREITDDDDIEDSYENDASDDEFLDTSKRGNHHWTNFTMNGEQWESLSSFAAKVGWNMTWMFNLFTWSGPKTQVWDPTNAKLLLDFSVKKGIKIDAFQIGNEPNAYRGNYGFQVKPPSLVKAIQALRNTLKEYPEYSKSAIYGPEVTWPNAYLKEFLTAGGCKAVTDVAWHQYYMSGRAATVDQMMNPKVLDDLKRNLQLANNIMNSSCDTALPLRLTETGSCYGGGAPGLSNRFVAGFMWLDKLGLSAQAGLSVVHRQTFFSGSYALVRRGLVPTPDYFLSVLYKRLILGPVLRAKFEPSTPMLRMYAHCVRQDYYNYPKGAVVLYYMNINNKEITLNLTKFQDQEFELFLLTPGDGGMTSQSVKLNGKLLEMQGSDKSELPSLNSTLHRGNIQVSPQSFGFIVIPKAQVKTCL